jgi:DNA-dependent protein kinase catalytic subunit
LSSSVAQRLKETLTILYAPDVEEHWLQNSTRLVLSLCKRTAAYDTPLFKPLTEASMFSEYRIDLGGFERSVAMTPMFSLSQSQAEGDMQAMASLPEISMDPAAAMIRATNPDPFSNSQSALASSMDREGFSSSPGGSGAAPSPMSKMSGTPQFKKPRPEPPQLFNRALAPAAANALEDGAEGEVRLTKRFQKASEEEAARKAKMKKKLRERVELRQKEARAHKVVMYRSYRTGELPDVAIKPKDILEPLQVLTTRDSSMARLLYSILFLSIYEHAPERDRRVLREEASEAIEKVMRLSRCTAPVIGALERICFEGKVNKL